MMITMAQYYTILCSIEYYVALPIIREWDMYIPVVIIYYVSTLTQDIRMTGDNCLDYPPKCQKTKKNRNWENCFRNTKIGP